MPITPPSPTWAASKVISAAIESGYSSEKLIIVLVDIWLVTRLSKSGD